MASATFLLSVAGSTLRAGGCTGAKPWIFLCCVSQSVAVATVALATAPPTLFRRLTSLLSPSGGGLWHFYCTSSSLCSHTGA